MSPQSATTKEEAVTIRPLGHADVVPLEAHYRRLSPHDALNLFGAFAETIAIRRHIAGINFGQDIILAAVDSAGSVGATVRICARRESRWAELLVAREQDRVAAERWRSLVLAGVQAARDSSVRWLSVASLGFDPETREALTLAGFDLHAEEDGTIGELCLANCARRRNA